MLAIGPLRTHLHICGLSCLCVYARLPGGGVAWCQNACVVFLCDSPSLCVQKKGVLSQKIPISMQATSQEKYWDCNTVSKRQPSITGSRVTLEKLLAPKLPLPLPS